jgi:ribosomal protein S16
MGAWEYEACGASWADYDNDGLLDLATAPAMGLRPLLWHNNGDGTFTDRAPLDGMTDVRDFQANCWADYDLDGLMDLLVGAADDYSCLYHNNGPAASYLRIRVLTDSDGDATDENTDEDRDAIGARVEVNLDNDTSFPPGRTLLRLVDGGSSWMGQNEPVAQFGLGTGPTLVALRVGFPDGSIVAMDSVGVNQEVVISDIAQTFGSLSGTVTDALTDLPIENARAVCSYLTAASDSSGDYLIPRIPAGTGYTMRARAYGYCEAARSDVAVGEETTTVEDFGLLPAPDNIGLYAAAAGTFYLRNSNSTGGANVTFRFGPAPSTWAAFSGDWDADLDETVGMYEQATSTWRLRNSNTPGVSDLKFRFGPAPCAWKPIAGDWDGDGVDTVGLYDPATGTFRLRNSNTAGVSDVKFRFGPAPCSWLPIAGDWNGDGIDTVGLYDPATGTFRLININATAATADLKYRFGPAPCSWLPIAGDWDSDGTETVGLYDPATDTFRLINSNVTHSVADVKFVFGPISGTQQPIAGDWDGM